MQEDQKCSVVITDYDYDDVGIERAIIEGAGFELVAAQCKTEDDVIGVARDGDRPRADSAGGSRTDRRPHVTSPARQTSSSHSAR